MSLQGYINVDWTKQYLDNLYTPVNNNNGTSGGKLVNGYNATSGNTGTLYLVQVYDTDGNQATYLDALNNKFWLCCSIQISSTTPTSGGKGTSATYSSSSTNIITFFGQYFDGGSPSNGAVSGVNSYYGGNYYQVWSGTPLIPIGNPSFTITTAINNVTPENSCSLFLTSVNTTNGVYIGTSSSSNLSTWSNTSNYGNTTYAISATLNVSDGDISTTDTNLFTNSSNTSQTYGSTSSSSLDTTYYKDYTNNNYYQKTYGSSYPPATAGVVKLNITISP